MEERVTVGRIGRPHGLHGELYVLSDSDAPERYRPGAVFLTDEHPPRRLEVRSSRYRQDKLMVVFVGISNRTDAESLGGVDLTIATAERRPLDKDEFWPDELVGLAVQDPDGRPIGAVSAVETSGPQDRLVVRTADGRETSVPFVRELVPEVRRAEGLVVIHPIEGLFNPSPD